MDLVWATADFQLAGRSYEGFPILLDAELRGIEPANRFLRYWLIHRGRSFSKKSWPTVANHLLDYFGFLERAGLLWHQINGEEGESPVAAYRYDAVEKRALNPRTVNQRLGTVLRFYTYAREQQWIDKLPFSYVALTTGARGHSPHPHARLRYSADVVMRVQRAQIEYLTRDQIKQLLCAVVNPTHRMMIRVGLQVGLRREEIATFPVSSVEAVIDQAKLGSMVKIRLDPRDGSGQKTKGARQRIVYFPSSLIADLWGYLVHDRPRLARRSELESTSLFLTATGQPWAGEGKAFHTILQRAGKKVGFAVHPHLLRHTYATHTLASLQQQGARGLDPLVFVQRQLGHSSIETTLCYAHVANELAISAMTTYDEEITRCSR